MYAEVAVNLPTLRGVFHYSIPTDILGRLQPGHLVTVPFGPRRVQGLVLRLSATTPVPETRPVEALVDPRPALTPAQLQFANWLHQQTLAPLIDCLSLMFPPGLAQRADTLYRVLQAGYSTEDHSQRRLLALLAKRGPLGAHQIDRALGRRQWRRAADALVKLAVLERAPVLNPPQVHPRHVRMAQLAVSPEAARLACSGLERLGSAASLRRFAVVEKLIAEGEPLEVTWLYAECRAKPEDLRRLRQAGVLRFGEQEVWRDPLAEVDFVPDQAPVLTPEQEVAWTEIRQALQQSLHELPLPILLHGVTGSGKTELYLQAVAETLALGRRALILVPEISLTPQTVRRFLARFPGRVGLVHSQLSQGERFDTWRRCREGQLSVIIGPRSALFSPLTDIGLIVVDDAHDDSFKEQTSTPRYHAREASIAYARLLGAVCILGTATPDVVTMRSAEKGTLRRLTLPHRVIAHRQRVEQQALRLGVTPQHLASDHDARYADLPTVRVVDMRQELRAGNPSLFSRPLQQALKETFEARQQAILFLNRRGSSTYVFCRECGHSLRCSRCDTPLTYHSVGERLLCHHCGYHRLQPTKCPNCGSLRIRHFGAGTQRIEAEVERLIPGVRTLRWDWDVTRRKGSHDLILAHFAAHRADLLIGTQMIAKGLDLPLVTLVGVVLADLGLNLPDYRAAERSFQVLTQVAGRAGRGLLGGRVILQTYQPEHFAIRAAAGHDYHAFYTQELRHRRQLGYPPFRRLARLLYKHASQEIAEGEAKRLARVLRARAAKLERELDLIGPVPCFYRRLRGDYRWQIILRSGDPLPLIPVPLPTGWTLDIDPISLL